jgi:hypothetical protein
VTREGFILISRVRIPTECKVLRSLYIGVPLSLKCVVVVFETKYITLKCKNKIHRNERLIADAYRSIALRYQISVWNSIRLQNKSSCGTMRRCPTYSRLRTLLQWGRERSDWLPWLSSTLVIKVHLHSSCLYTSCLVHTYVLLLG